MENENLATELLRMVKYSTKKWFIIAIVELGIIAILIACFFIIPTDTYTETEYTQEVEDIDRSEVTQHIRDKYYGESEANGN